MKKVEVSQDKCIGCGACVAIAEENFSYNDEGKSVVIDDTVTDKTIEASESCPTEAITIKEEN